MTAPASPPSPPVVLVVDDDDGVRALAATIVEDMGCAVLAAHDGGEAMRLVESGRTVDLLFTDIVMPGMDGFELARRAKTVRPELAVLYATGYAQLIPHSTGETFGPILSKPYRPQRVVEEIRKALA